MVPVVTIDGPSGSGKGTIAGMLAQQLKWHCLDSGALYRLVGFAADHAGISIDQVSELEHLARTMDVEFRSTGIWLNCEEVTTAIRTEQVGNAASKAAAIPEVRAALLEWQREYARIPGLVADGRDMGSVVFPDAGVKIFLTASADERAKRRYNQLKEKGLDANLPDLITEIEERDERDSNRSVAPLKAPVGALEIESTALSIDEVLELVMGRVRDAFPELAI
ncbi:MAG: (d)CMP kinase [Sedimenticola sp.]